MSCSDFLAPGSVEALNRRSDGSRGGVVTVVGVFVLGRWDQSDLAVQAPMVGPVEVFGDLEVVDVLPGPLVADQFGLEPGSTDDLGLCGVIGVVV